MKYSYRSRFSRSPDLLLFPKKKKVKLQIFNKILQFMPFYTFFSVSDQFTLRRFGVLGPLVRLYSSENAIVYRYIA